MTREINDAQYFIAYPLIVYIFCKIVSGNIYVLLYQHFATFV